MAEDFKILMVCTEYPPMQGGVDRYTHNLVRSLHSNGLKVIVVSDSDGFVEHKGISPYNWKIRQCCKVQHPCWYHFS